MQIRGVYFSTFTLLKSKKEKAQFHRIHILYFQERRVGNVITNHVCGEIPSDTSGTQETGDRLHDLRRREKGKRQEGKSAHCCISKLCDCLPAA